MAEKFGVRPHLFTAWAMGRYAALRNLKYLAYPFYLRRMVERVARIYVLSRVLGTEIKGLPEEVVDEERGMFEVFRDDKKI